MNETNSEETRIHHVVLVTTVNSTSYAFSGFTPNTGYQVTVKAVDAAGNKSDLSNSLSVTTSPEFTRERRRVNGLLLGSSCATCLGFASVPSIFVSAKKEFCVLCRIV